VLGNLYDAAEFLQVETYTNVVRWAKMLGLREAVQRGRIVNCSFGEK
jgi:GST-like protein